MSYNNYRRKSKKVKVGSIFVGGDAPLTVQSMTNVSSSDFSLLFKQIKELEEAKCDIVRMTVPDDEAVRNIAKLKESGVRVPLVADIHFNYRLAIESAAAGADKIRINPGNIGDEDRVKAVVTACRNADIPIRIGVNGGSLEKELLQKYGSPTPEALVESAICHIKLLEKFDFFNTIIAVKSSDVRNMIKANRLLSEICDYPIHLGVTEAGTHRLGTLRSAAGIGAMLCDGIGDTIRVSLTDNPVNEVIEGRALLRSLGLDESSKIRVISCPTCGRTKINIIEIANQVEARLCELKSDKPITVAVMGCAVNGPGESKGADIGIAAGDGNALLFKHGEFVCKLSEDVLIETLVNEVKKIIDQK